MIAVRWLALGIVVAAGCNRLLELEKVEVPADGIVGSDADATIGAPDWVNGGATADSTHSSMVSVTLVPPPTPGHEMVVAVATYQSNVTGVTDSANNAYYVTGASPVNSSAGAIWIALGPVVATHDPFTVSVAVASTGGPPEVSLSADEYSGLEYAVGPVTSTSNTGNVPIAPCGTVAVAAGQIVYAAITIDGGGATSAGPGFKLRHDPTTSITNQIPLAVEDELRAPAGNITPQFGDTQQSWACEAIVLR